VVVAPRRGIVTPEAVVLEFETASVGSRTVAGILDVLAQITIFSFGTFLANIIVFFLFASTEYALTASITLFALISFAALFGYPIFMETRFSATLGMLALGLRVVTREGAPIRFRHAAIRAAFLLVDVWLIPIGVIGILAMTFSRQSQRLGDMAAGTVVLRQPSRALRSVPVAFFAPPGLEHYVATLDANAVTAEQYGLIRLFLMRVRDLSPAARGTLAHRLAGQVAARTHQPLPAWLHPEIYLICVAAAYQGRHGGHAPAWYRPWGTVPQAS
jgi:uncharacterized RDD family membrane protein YckC